MILDREWVYVKEPQFSEEVRAVLLKKEDEPGCARVESKEKPSRYIMTMDLDGIVLVVAKPRESIIILGNISVCCFRRR